MATRKPVKDVEDIETTEETQETTLTPAPVEKAVVTTTPPKQEEVKLPERVEIKSIIHRIAGKDYRLPVFQIVHIGRGIAGYGPEGQRVTQYEESEAGMKQVTRFITQSNVLQQRKHSHDATGLAPTSNPLLR